MIQTAEEVIETVRALPKAEREKFFNLLEVEKNNSVSKSEEKTISQKERERFRLAMKWINENRQNYLNEWVCLDGDKLIAHGKDGVKIYQEAREKGIKVPFVEHIIEDKPYGGGIEACRQP